MSEPSLKQIDKLVITLSWTREEGFEDCEVGVGNVFGTNLDDSIEAVEEYVMPVLKGYTDELMETLDAMFIPDVCHNRMAPIFEIQGMLEEVNEVDTIKSVEDNELLNKRFDR